MFSLVIFIKRVCISLLIQFVIKCSKCRILQDISDNDATKIHFPYFQRIVIHSWRKMAEWFARCLLYGLEFIVFLLLVWLLFKSQDSSLFCHLIYNWERIDELSPTPKSFVQKLRQQTSLEFEFGSPVTFGVHN